MAPTTGPPDEADDPYDDAAETSGPSVPDAFGFGPSLFGRQSGGDDLGPASEEPLETGTEDRRLITGELATLLLVVGAVLVLVPEPATSALGVGLVSVGAVVWLLDRS